jgi:hypothetical protein
VAAVAKKPAPPEDFAHVIRRVGDLLHKPPESGELAVDEAKRGNPILLSARLNRGDKLTKVEIKFILEMWHAIYGKKVTAEAWRMLEQVRIARQVVVLTKGTTKHVLARTKGKTKQEYAVRQVMEQTGLSRRQVFIALETYKDQVTAEIEEAVKLMDPDGTSGQSLPEVLELYEEEMRKGPKIEEEISAKKF